MAVYAVPHWYPAQVYDTKERRVVWLVGVNNTNKEFSLVRVP